MKKFDVQIALEKLAEARKEWTSRRREFDEGVDRVMGVLLHEAARNFMGVGDIAKASGLQRSRVRDLMRKHGLNPTHGKRVLSDQAAKALNENAALLGVDVHDMDLTSPLAYLPMGEQMRRALQDQRIAVTAEDIEVFPETQDTLPQWLAMRFGQIGGVWPTKWSDLPSDDAAYWEHEAQAVRRAVARDGFKNYDPDSK